MTYLSSWQMSSVGTSTQLLLWFEIPTLLGCSPGEVRGLGPTSAAASLEDHWELPYPYISLVTLPLCSVFSSEAFQKGGRKGAKKVMIVITDGESHDSPDLEKVIQQSERDNVTRYAVAVSPAPPVPPSASRGFTVRPLGTPRGIFWVVSKLPRPPDGPLLVSSSPKEHLGNFLSALSRAICNSWGQAGGWGRVPPLPKPSKHKKTPPSHPAPRTLS